MTTTTTSVSKVWAPDGVASFTIEDLLADSLYALLTKKAGEIVGDEPSLRVPYVEDDDDTATWVAEGAQIPEADIAMDEVVIQSRKIAETITVSNEQAGKPATPQTIANSMKRALTKKLNRALISQVAPTAPAIAPSVGLVNTPSLLNGGTISTNLDPLIDTISTLDTNGANPSILLVSPDAWGSLYKLKRGTASQNVGLLSPATDSPNTPVLGLQMIRSNQLPAKTALVIDPSAIVSAWSAIQIASSADAEFRKDSIVYRGTVRCGHVVPKPNRIAKLIVDLGAAE